ncbi:MAG: hypothetical protein ACYC1D_19820 [Acidimicrobiales bacterium]|nr:hypothetical protein [Actinomycetota bacterium]
MFTTPSPPEAYQASSPASGACGTLTAPPRATFRAHGALGPDVGAVIVARSQLRRDPSDARATGYLSRQEKFHALLPPELATVWVGMSVSQQRPSI